MKTEGIYRFLRSALWRLALICTAGICLLNLVFRSEVSYDAWETVTISSGVVPGILMTAVIAAVIVILSRVQGFLECVDEKRFFRLLAVAYSICAAYLILNVDPQLRADAKFVYRAALRIREGNFADLMKGGYLYRYPHQLGLMLYDQLLASFSENTQFYFLVNFLMVLGINRTTWKISEELFHDRLTNLLTILFSFGFIPQLFFILFVYGLIPGFFFLLLGFYHTLRFLRTDRTAELALILPCIGAAVLLKQNYLIGGIAVAIVLLLHVLKKFSFRCLSGVVLLLLFMTVPGNFIRQAYEKKAEVSLVNGCPTVLWVAMGTDIDNHLRGPGWYDGSSWKIYNEVNFNKEAASEAGREMLTGNLEKIAAEPGRAFCFFVKKEISQWCDAMFQSVWTGPMVEMEQNTHTGFLKSVYGGGTWENRLEALSKLVCLAIWLLAVCFLMLQGRNVEGWELMFLYFIGGLIFHTFWEAKSQYTMTYLFCLIPFAARGGRTLIDRIKKVRQ